MLKTIKSIITLAFLLVTLTSCTNAKEETIKVVKTDYDIEQCKKKEYKQEDLEEYKKLIKSGEIQGYNCIGIFYIKKEKEYKKAEEYFKKGIQSGSIESYYQLGSLYSSFMNKDFEDIIKLYKKAANLGHVQAMHNLGVQYYNQAKFDEAIKWYEKSANSGDNYSLEALGHTYRMKGNLEKAKEIYLKLAVEKKDPQGYKNLGIFYSKENKYKDLEKSKEYFLKCAKLGDSNCYGSIAAAIYEKNKDYKNAIKWYKKGFEAGGEKATSRLGYLYKDLKDYDKAIYWFNKCYEKFEYLNCAFNLGILYEENLNDYKNALNYYFLMHNKGDSDGTQRIGYLYEKRLKDYKNAEIWYKKALDTKKNDKRAKRGLKRLKKLGVLSE